MKTPMHFDEQIDAESVARFLTKRWRDGLRQPRLGQEAHDVFPGLTLAQFNRAATIAWESLTADERKEAANEAS
ncbi:hypothetical protein ACFSQQ_14650 [Mesorhizobium kowhaii]|uniref:hypothetical protein n=1 Tax=Mesorhizobium kowhaii TaxID=1300272 RepID=UPI0035F011C9